MIADELVSAKSRPIWEWQPRLDILMTATFGFIYGLCVQIVFWHYYGNLDHNELAHKVFILPINSINDQWKLEHWPWMHIHTYPTQTYSNHISLKTVVACKYPNITTKTYLFQTYPLNFHFLWFRFIRKSSSRNCFTYFTEVESVPFTPLQCNRLAFTHNLNSQQTKVN
jgi:hypothetical protein